MLKFGETKVAKEESYDHKRKKNITTKNWDVHVHNTAISKLVEAKTNSKC